MTHQKSRRFALSSLSFILAAAWGGLGATRSVEAQPRPIRPNVIYGEDNRKNLSDVTNPLFLKLADSTVALMKSDDLTLSQDGKTFVIAGKSYAQEMNLCTDEPFFNEKNAAFCSGSLVGPDLVLTAGHCVTSALSCARTRFAFGYAIRTAGTNTPDSLPANEVYECAELLGRTQDRTGADFAVLRLNRPVLNHAPLAVNRTGDIPVGTSLVVIGHPSGLATKVADGATVRSNDKPGFFVANTDTYGGNSGSAVFNSTTGLIEGILVRGEEDFKYDFNQGCSRSNRCPLDGCRGEDVTRVSETLHLIPAQP